MLENKRNQDGAKMNYELTPSGQTMKTLKEQGVNEREQRIQKLQEIMKTKIKGYERE